MGAIGVLLLVIGGFIVIEVVKGGGIASASTATNTGALNPGNTSGSGSVAVASSSDVATNVTRTAAFAKANGIDPRVALTILAGESQGGSGAYNPADPYGGSAGPLQINGINGPGGFMTAAFRSFVSNIDNALSLVASRWRASLSGVSYSQFLSNPEYFYDAAQGGQPSVVASNLAANDNFAGIVSQWCQQYGVC